MQFEIKSRATPSHQEISLNEARRYVGMSIPMQVGDLLFLTHGRTGTKFKSYKNNIRVTLHRFRYRTTGRSGSQYQRRRDSRKPAADARRRLGITEVVVCSAKLLTLSHETEYDSYARLYAKPQVCVRL